jgi:hypothetical protein
MKKISLIAVFIITALLLQECKKDTYSAYASAPFSLIATINDTTWTTDTVTAILTYSSASQSKKFECTGTAFNKKVFFSVSQSNQSNTSSFPIANYTNNSTGVTMSYFLNTKNSQGTFTYIQQGTVAAGSGFVNITAIDSVNNLITGTFSFTSNTNTYSPDGQIISIHDDQIQNGGFTNLPYKFVKQ